MLPLLTHTVNPAETGARNSRAGQETDERTQ